MLLILDKMVVAKFGLYCLKLGRQFDRDVATDLLQEYERTYQQHKIQIENFIRILLKADERIKDKIALIKTVRPVLPLSL